jgi:hypothetical protein
MTISRKEKIAGGLAAIIGAGIIAWALAAWTSTPGITTGEANKFFTRYYQTAPQRPEVAWNSLVTENFRVYGPSSSPEEYSAYWRGKGQVGFKYAKQQDGDSKKYLVYFDNSNPNRYYVSLKCQSSLQTRFFFGDCPYNSLYLDDTDQVATRLH